MDRGRARSRALVRKALVASMVASALTVEACQPLDERSYEPAPGSIKIGLLVTRFPLFSAFAARLAAQEINRAGGVLGKTVEIVPGMDRLCDMEHSPTVAQWLVDQGAVAVVVGQCSAAVTNDLSQVFGPTRRDVPVLSVSSTSPTLTGVPNFFRTVPSDVWQGRALADEIWRQGVLTVSLVQIDDVYGNGLSDAFEKRYVELGGRVLERVKTAPEKERDFKPEVAELFSAGKPQAVVIVELAVGGAALTRDLAVFADVSGVRFFAAEAFFAAGFILNADAAIVEGMQGLIAAPDPSDPNGQRFVASYEQAVAEPILDSELSRLQGIYDGVYLLALAMQRGGSATSASIRGNIVAVSGTKDGVGTKVVGGEFARASELLRSGTEVNYEGATGPIDLDESGDPSRGTYLLWRVEHGRFVLDRAVRFP